jgi:hypothetical protein
VSVLWVTKAKAWGRRNLAHTLWSGQRWYPRKGKWRGDEVFGSGRDWKGTKKNERGYHL